ncbi:MAG: 30S ribosomal protein S20 [Elusimicrobia bacterium]|nr:30S ribosomal protein S20 [Elusimicrobiota bacterium]
MAKLKTGRHTGAIKTHRQSVRRMLRNRSLKKKAREAAREFLAGLKDKAKAKTLASAAASTLDKAAKKGTIHWKTAARRKSRIALRLQKAAA